jgi:hypothetical protein
MSRIRSAIFLRFGLVFGLNQAAHESPEPKVCCVGELVPDRQGIVALVDTGDRCLEIEPRKQVIQIKRAYLHDHRTPPAHCVFYGKDRPYLGSSLRAAVSGASLKAVIWIALSGAAVFTKSGHSIAKISS